VWTYTSSSSEDREHIEEEEKARGKETQDRSPQKEQEEKRGKGQAAEPKTVGGTKAQTPREKWLQSRVERTKMSKQVRTQPRKPHQN